MKTINILSVIMGTALIALGCSKQNSQAVNDPYYNKGYDPYYYYNNGNNTTPGVLDGYVVDFNLASQDALVRFITKVNPVVSPTGAKLSFNLKRAQDKYSGRFVGTMKVSYIEAGTRITGKGLVASDRLNPTYSGLKDNGTHEAEFNTIFTYNSQAVFSGFFQDQYGAMIVVLKPDNGTTNSNGHDGEVGINPGTYSGSIYFKNFPDSFLVPWSLATWSTTFFGFQIGGYGLSAPQSPLRPCWFIYKGPYSCRSNAVAGKTSIDPTGDGYELLGTVSNIDIKKALGL